MVHAQQVKEARAKKKSRDVKRESSFDGGFQRVGLISKTSLGSRKGFPTKFLSNYLWLEMIGCLTLSLGREGVLAHQPKIQLVKSAARSILVNALREWIIMLIVEKVIRRLRITLMLRVKTRLVVKLKKVVLMMLLKRIAFMYFA